MADQRKARRAVSPFDQYVGPGGFGFYQSRHELQTSRFFGHTLRDGNLVVASVHRRDAHQILQEGHHLRLALLRDG